MCPKKTKIILLFLPVLFLTGCTDVVQKSLVLREDEEIIEQEITGEGNNLAIEIVQDKDLGHGWSIKNGVVYFHHWAMRQIDPLSLQILSDKYSKDKSQVYFCYLNGCSAVERDPETFTVLEDKLYQKDKNGVYRGSSQIEGADPESFVSFNGEIMNNFAKDKNYVYFFGRKIDGANAKTFEVLRENIGRDANHYFNGERMIENIDTETFSFINNFYAKDKNAIYYCNHYECKNISSLVSEFIVLNDFYAKDSEKVYYESEVIYDVDLNSFIALEDGYAKDKNYFFFKGVGHGKNSDDYYELYLLRRDPSNCRGQEHTTKDQNTFIDLGDGYGKDSQCVFYFDYPIDKSHPSSFEILADNFFRDRNYVYYTWPKDKSVVRLGNAIPSSFEVLGNGFARDKERVFSQSMIILADLETFKPIDPESNKWGFNGEDKDYYFKNDEATLKFLVK